MRARLLVVDDDSMVRDAVRMLLESRGHHVETAASGEEGVEAVRRNTFHLVLLDLKMPGIGGLEALRRMKEHDPGLPVVVFTGYSSIESAKEAVRSGAADYLTKPVEQQKLIEEVGRHARVEAADARGSVMVVDDDPDVLQSILMLLEEADIPAEGFTRGDLALLKAARGQGRVLLTDQTLADADGLRLIRQVAEARPDMVSVLLTGAPSIEATVEALRLGAFDYLAKPVQPERLLEVVRQALERARSRSLPGSVHLGRAYGFEDRKGCRELFRALAARGFPGVWISRDLPGPGERPRGTSAFRLGNSGAPGTPAIPDPERLTLAVEEFCRARNAIVLLEGLEFLSAKAGFDAAYRALCGLRDVVAATDSVLLVPFSPAAFGERERALLQRELEVRTGADRAALWEETSAKLPGDERTLHDLLRTAEGKRHQADLISATGFSKAKMTRLLDRMERNGLLRRQRDGMGNLVALA